jgi:hypothetical protein
LHTGRNTPVDAEVAHARAIERVTNKPTGDRRMGKYHNTLLTTVAAVALVVSAGLASAQEHSQAQSPGATPGASQSNPTGQRPGGAPSATQQRPSSSAQRQPSNTPATAQEQQRRSGTGAQQQQPSNNPASAQEEQRRNGMRGQPRPSTAQEQPSRGGPNTAQGRNGLNANASGTNVQLSEQQRTEFRRTIIDARGAPKVGHVDFDVAVGTVVPRDRIHVVPVPDTLVQIEPSWRGFLYFVYTDEIVVVNPHDMRIVAVLMV